MAVDVATHAVIELEAVSKRFGDLEAVRALSFAVQPGEVFGLVGPDGAGKTTTMRMVAGLMPPTAGVLRVLGHDLGRQLSAVRGRIGYMPQHYSLYGDLSVQENLRFFAGMFGVPRAEMLRREKRLLGIARLDAFRDREAGALSGGMYKKLALSCALVHAPPVLLLDEPTNGVDPISRRELWQFLDELVGEGVGVLITTPYMDEAERCGRVGLLVEGRLVASGTPAALKAAFDATVFEVSTPAPLGTTAPFADLDGVDEAYTMGRRIHVVTHRGAQLRGPIAAAARAAGADRVRIDEVAPSFEDVFLHLAAAAEGSEAEATPDAADTGSAS
jgi:ABC-2 type transport system ATP-binding protein